MAKGNLLVVRRALLIFAFAISLGAGNAFADMQGDFTFWFSVVKIEEVNPGAIMLSGTVAGLPVRVLLDANAKVSDSRPPDMELRYRDTFSICSAPVHPQVWPKTAQSPSEPAKITYHAIF
jgi:hypothetical protein